MVSLWRRWRRSKILARPFPDAWQAWVEQRVPHYESLSADELARLRDDIQVFVAEKNWEGCNGLVVTDEMKVAVAAQACLMALGLPDEPFRRVLSILIYPAGYAVPEERWHQGWSIRGETARLGESWYRGPVILSWEEIDEDAQNPGDGRNLVWHEFAHQIDMLDRSVNGTPPLETSRQRRRWHDVMTREFEQLRRDAAHGRATLLDSYGADSEAEFFAVASECFFDCPVELRARHPQMYDVLREYYRQDPAARIDGS